MEWKPPAREPAASESRKATKRATRASTVPGSRKQGGFALHTHCRTTLLPDVRTLFPDAFAYEGNRAIHFNPGAPLPTDRLRLFVHSALTYHLK